MLALQAPSNQIISRSTHPQVDPYLWLNYFDPDQALQSVINHVETLPGSRHERHTMRAYLGSLAHFTEHLGGLVKHYGDERYDFVFGHMTMPTADAVKDYVAHCKRSGLTSSTITRYMAAVRHFIRALEEQPVYPQSGSDFVFILEAQRQFRLASGIKNPPADRTSNRPALEQHGTRLSLIQVNTLFSSFASEMHTLTGQRDLCLMYLGITSGLRAAELARMTLNSITPGKDCYEVRVRGKRSNHDPIGIDATAYDLVMKFVTAWNNRLIEMESFSPRHCVASLWDEGEGPGVRAITSDVPIFQPLLRGDHIPPIGLRSFDPQQGLSARAILKIVDRRTERALGSGITAHDMRRTCAYLMRSHGYEWDQIRAQLRHRSIGTTEKYVGQEQDLSRALLSKRVHFTIPRADSLPLAMRERGAGGEGPEVQS